MNPCNTKKGMKKILTIVALLLPVIVSAQAQITTKKVKLMDFSEKTTKIVLSGNPFIDTELEDAVKNNWEISPYEFCSLEEFNQLKTKDDYYFLMTVLGKFRKEAAPGLTMLSLVKGGKGADIGLNKMLEVVTVPLCSAEEPGGREIVFLPALIDIIQEHVLASMNKDYNAYGGLSSSAGNIDKADSAIKIFSENDLTDSAAQLVGKLAEDSDKVRLVTEEEADDIMAEGREDCLVSYVVAPTNPMVGSFCYKMLIDSRTHRLYYYRKHRISNTLAPGFLKEDIFRMFQK